MFHRLILQLLPAAIMRAAGRGFLRPNPDKMLEQSKEEDSTTSLVTLPGSIADSVLDAAGNYLLKPSA